MKDDVSKAMSMLDSIVSDRVEYIVSRDKNRYHVNVYVKESPTAWALPHTYSSKYLIVAVRSAMSKAAIGKL